MLIVVVCVVNSSTVRINITLAGKDSNGREWPVTGSSPFLGRLFDLDLKVILDEAVPRAYYGVISELIYAFSTK